MSEKQLTPEVVNALILAKQYKDSHKREFPPDFYPWQRDYFADPAPQKMLMAGNQTGKTMSTGFEFACHCTADYPDWWDGPRTIFTLNAMALGVDGEQLKEVVQKTLFGEVDDRKQFSGGWIHPAEIIDVEWSGTVTGLARRVRVRSKYGTTTITLRQYTQSKTGSGSLSFAGSIFDLIWVDECPPDTLVGQLVMRTINGMRRKGGWIRYSMTPELGVTQLVDNFMNNRKGGQALHGPIAWDQCKHLTEDVQEQILAGIPEHEHDMRRKGIPFFGSGLIYPYPESRYVIDDFEISQIPWATVLRAMDLGIDHPTAIAWMAYDPEIDRIYLLRDYQQSGEAAAIHAAVANQYLKDSPVVFPPDVDTSEKGSGKTVRDWYHKAGLTNTLDFKNPDDSKYVEPGIMDLNERLKTDRLKICRSCVNTIREMRLYHRKDGKIVKKNDDSLDALRYGAMMIPRYGVPQNRRRGRKPRVHRAMDS